MLSFCLTKEFVNEYRELPEPFGYQGLGKITFYRTYSRKKSNGEQETWVDVCERVINGMYSIQKDHCLENNRPWNDDAALRSAQEAFDRLFYLKWSPSGRGLWMLGSDFIHDRKTSESLLNCAFISTKDIAEEKGTIFEWFMEMLMLGVGVGGDTKGADQVPVNRPESHYYSIRTYTISDSREGWAKSVGDLINTYLDAGTNRVYEFDYSLIRPKGEPIKGFGGMASGPEPLIKLHNNIRKVLDELDGGFLTSRAIVDIFNMIGACVIAGNVRRSAEIMLGEPDDDEFLNLKNYEENPDRAEWGWSSNNSVFANTGMDYSKYSQRIIDNGEPGFIWMDNVNGYGRMGEKKVDNAEGVNPCGEQPLASREMCLLVEVYPNRNENMYDYIRSLKFAYLYAKTVSLTYEWIKDDKSRNVMTKNRRIGVSNTGIVQFVSHHGLPELRKWMDAGYKTLQHYDKKYSMWLDIPESIRTTTVKPSGSVSLLAGVTPGVHFPHSQYYIRRIRLQEDTSLLKVLKSAGFKTEKDVYSDNTEVVEFPIFAGDNVRAEKDVSLWEQFELAATMQELWSDNSVSVTIKFDPKTTTPQELESALNHYQYRLKSVSLLPEVDGGAYAQMPYEAITKEQYEQMVANTNMDKLNNLGKVMSLDGKMLDLYCDSESCELPFAPKKEVDTESAIKS